MEKLDRIQIQIEPEFKRRVLVKVAENGITIKSIVHKLLKDWLENDKQGS